MNPTKSFRFLTMLFLLPLVSLTASPLPVIFDTDMDSDVDDVAALCKLHAMADRGELELLGVAISGHNEWSAPCVDALNTFYGRPDLTIALVSGTRGIRQDSRFARQVAEAFPQDFKEKHEKIEAVPFYRKLLAKAEDKSVMIISVGDLTNLAALLVSPGDGYSPLSGQDLVAAKVKEYVCMGSRYPADTDPGTVRWGNFRTDPVSAREVVLNWPTMITFTGGGDFAASMAIGKKIADLDPAVWPVSLAYRSYFGGTGQARHAADSIAVWVAVRGLNPYFKVVEEGYNEIDDVGRNIWHDSPDVPNRRYTSALNNPKDADKLRDLMEEMAMQPPAAGLPGRPPKP
jgi:hypothetical protein